MLLIKDVHKNKIKQYKMTIKVALMENFILISHLLKI